MKTLSTLKKAVIGLGLGTFLFAPTQVLAQTQDPMNSTYYGFGFGGVVTELPVSKAIDSGFAVFMADVYYAKYLTPPEKNFRVAAILGLYGFQILLPVPKVGIEATLGKPTDDVQFKGYVGGIYDLFIGGHAGLDIGVGVLLNNRFTVGFHLVPFGKDSERDYFYMIGKTDTERACTDSVPCVEMPYFGLFAGLQF